MELIQRRRGLLGNVERGGYPPGYEKLVRLISNGNQRIDTQYNPRYYTTDYFRMDFSCDLLTKTQIYFGATGSSGISSHCQLVLSNGVLRRGDIAESALGSPLLGQKISFVYSNGIITCNARTASITDVCIGSNYRMYLFGKGSETSTLATESLYEVEYNTETVPVMHLIPMLRMRDSKPGLYDTVRKIFLVNSLSREFGYEKEDGTIVPAA